MTNSHASSLRCHHVANHGARRVAEVRPETDAQVPEGFEPLGHRALATRLGCCPRTARYRLERLAAMQGRPDVLRVVRLPVSIGSGARRTALHVLWPKQQLPEAAG